MRGLKNPKTSATFWGPRSWEVAKIQPDPPPSMPLSQWNRAVPHDGSARFAEVFAKVLVMSDGIPGRMDEMMEDNDDEGDDEASEQPGKKKLAAVCVAGYFEVNQKSSGLFHMQKRSGILEDYDMMKYCKIV